MNRRHFVQSGLAATLATSAGASTPKGRPPFRVLYSNDTTNLLSCISPYHAHKEPFRPEMIEASVDEVAGLVDAHFLQPGLGMVPMWPSKVFPLKEHYAWIRERYGNGPDPYGKFVLAGGDVVETFIDRCRAKGQAPFVSFRLNDAHHKEYVDPKPGDKPGGSIGMSVTRFYADHPEFRIRPGSPRGADRVQNFAVTEVREEKLKLIRELCENYDLDGFEIDFLRTYSYFRLEETPLEERRAIMTALVAEVRALLDRTAREGRRRWLCVRVPCFLPALDVLGIDLAAMVAAGVDMVNASSHYFTTQQHDLAAIRQRTTGAELYFELCHTLWKGDKVTAGYDVFPYRRATPEHLQTSAHLAYARGADGISLFNFAYYRSHGQGEGRGQFGEPPFKALADLDDRAALASAPQHWFLASGWRAPGVKPLPLPRKVEPDRTTAFVLDLAPPAGGWQGELRLRLQADGDLAGTEWRAACGGVSLADDEDVSEPFPVSYPSMLGEPGALRAWRVPAKLLSDGFNRFEVTLTGEGPRTVLFVDLATVV